MISSIPHNDRCRVCEFGGDLLCCDSCNQVFHLSCLIPLKEKLPAGDWFCQWCILEDRYVQKYRKSQAGKYIKKMMSEAHRTHCKNYQEALENEEEERKLANEKKHVKDKMKNMNTTRTSRACEVTPEKSVKTSLHINTAWEPIRFLHPTDETFDEKRVQFVKTSLQDFLNEEGALDISKMRRFIKEVILNSELLSMEIILVSIQLLASSDDTLVRDFIFRYKDDNSNLTAAQGVFIMWFQVAVAQIESSQVTNKESTVGVKILISILHLILRLDFRSDLVLAETAGLRNCINQSKEVGVKFGIQQLFTVSCELSHFLNKIPKPRKRRPPAAIIMNSNSGIPPEANTIFQAEIVARSAESQSEINAQSVSHDDDRGTPSYFLSSEDQIILNSLLKPVEKRAEESDEDKSNLEGAESYMGYLEDLSEEQEPLLEPMEEASLNDLFYNDPLEAEPQQHPIIIDGIQFDRSKNPTATSMNDERFDEPTVSVDDDECSSFYTQ